MYGTLILYRLPKKIPHNKANQFCKKLYGQDTSSHGSRYRYHLQGLLDKIPHHRLIRGAFIIRTEDVGLVVEFMRTYTDTIYIRDIKLKEDDCKKLYLPVD